jgi:protein-tyrosine phosphatase
LSAKRTRGRGLGEGAKRLVREADQGKGSGGTREVPPATTTTPERQPRNNDATPPRQTAPVRPPIVIEEGRLIAGRHPCAWYPGDAVAEVRDLLAQGVTLFVDLTEEGELEPYEHLLPAEARHLRLPIRDFSVPNAAELATTLDVLDAEIAAGGLVYVHCWAGCGRTGVVVGSWLVRHGLDPRHALARIAEARGAGCPQTLEQRLVVLGWEAGR